MIKGKLISTKSEKEDFILTPSDEAKICLNCPLKRCVNDNLRCKRYLSEKKKLKSGGKK